MVDIGFDYGFSFVTAWFFLVGMFVLFIVFSVSNLSICIKSADKYWTKTNALIINKANICLSRYFIIRFVAKCDNSINLPNKHTPNTPINTALISNDKQLIIYYLCESKIKVSPKIAVYFKTNNIDKIQIKYFKSNLKIQKIIDDDYSKGCIDKCTFIFSRMIILFVAMVVIGVAITALIYNIIVTNDSLDSVLLVVFTIANCILFLVIIKLFSIICKRYCCGNQELYKFSQVIITQEEYNKFNVENGINKSDNQETLTLCPNTTEGEQNI